MRTVLLALTFFAFVFAFANRDGHASIGHVQGGRNMDSLRGKTVRWTFIDGPVAGTRFEHTFHDDGSVVWRVLDGQGKGASAQEKRYATLQVAQDVHTVSYLAASGHTLTVVLNLATGRMFGFASNNTDWYPLTGTFEVVQ